MATTYEFVPHPRSGDMYACEMDDENGRIILAVGPIEWREYQDRAIDSTSGNYVNDPLARDIVNNAGSADALDDGEWLNAEIYGASAS